MADFLLASLVLSLVATVALNLLVRIPGINDWLGRRIRSLTESPPAGDEASGQAQPGPKVRVFVPWKAMLIGSIALTVIVNVLAALR